MIPAEQSHMHVAASSHSGMSGKNNEDRYAVSAHRLSQENPLPVVFAVVSDGIGGHRAGEVAAEIAVETISRIIASSDASQPIQTLVEAIGQASQAILDQAESDTDKTGMGATCACCWVIQNQLYTATVGDSRIYLIRGGAIQQLSTDHTWIQEALNAGLLTPEQARSHPNAHVIRRYLGSRQPVEPDTRLRLQAAEGDEQALANQGTELSPGDQLLLCSDGLTDLVNATEILSVLQENTDQKKGVQTLVDLANQRGGHDNITIVALRMPVPSRPRPFIQAARRANLNWNCLAIAAIFAVLVIAVLVGVLIYVQIFTPDTSPTATLTQPVLIQTQPLVTLDTPLPELTPTSPLLTATVEPATLTPWPTNTLSPSPTP